MSVFNFVKVMARKDALVKEFADYRAQQLSSGAFKFIRAQARFADKHTLALEYRNKTHREKFRHQHRLDCRARSPALP